MCEKKSTAPLQWVGQADGHLQLLDQTLLPQRVEWIRCGDVESLVEAIRSLRVRGAPAIGIAAAYGVCLGLQTTAVADRKRLLTRLDQVIAQLAASRPTAVNLFWALERMRQTALHTLAVRRPKSCALGCSPKRVPSTEKTSKRAVPSAAWALHSCRTARVS